MQGMQSALYGHQYKKFECSTAVKMIDIQDGHLEILQRTSPPKSKCELSPNLMGGIGAT